MKFTAEQQNVTNDLIKYINYKGVEINSPEDLDKAFRDYLLNGSASHYYLQTADDHQKKQFAKEITKNL